MDEMIYRQITSPIIFVKDKIPYDAKSMLLKDRIIKFSGIVTMQSADYIQDLLLALDSLEEEKKDITLYINSPGGEVISGLGIYDTMQHIKSDVSTLCVGFAASMGSLLLHAGAPGRRYSLPHSTIMIHQVASGTLGKLRDIEISVEHVKNLEEKLLDIYVRHVPKDEEGYVVSWGGNPHSKSVKDVKPEKMSQEEAKEWLRKWAGQCDRYLNPEQAKEMGFIDGILE
ncbi:MAG: ATP-dependent Clp protease proteolytic subunit [Nanoarchaeota archaeon]|nr:ATP-dependent Clp protease proteolytic subunit [Nanoarchaeota archaeon]MBU4242165.1 ATP-dependent Clp protease proteolytic subunit [Nanoarchaeota archaeon]MBU4351854.1 ATP-dependent Clp protease proteolytic subunit [Nanoarchaeota archaeon]MBU4456217.1 ATP-dependent Clp protease proteolytic subunit [Nanoarchaeota archaeon]